MARACFPMFPSFQHGKYCFQCQFLFSRCKLFLRYTTGNFNENSSMQALAKLLRARASEHTSNFGEQFEQRPNFASTFKLWDHSIPLTHKCTCREASTLEKLKTRQSPASLDLCLKKTLVWKIPWLSYAHRFQNLNRSSLLAAGFFSKSH